jgi:hypothetical protein
MVVARMVLKTIILVTVSAAALLLLDLTDEVALKCDKAGSWDSVS